MTPRKSAKKAPKTKDPFVKVPLWWAVQAAQATKSPKAMVWLWLLHRVWKGRTKTVVMANVKLKTWGVTRLQKYRALRELEAAGLVTVDWRLRKSPVVTLLHL